jgi:hypothetical protein
MVRSVALDHLPDGLQLPPDLQEKAVFDGERKQLAFHGFMSKQDFDRLAGLSRDLPWQRTVEQLFQLCVYEEQEERPPVLWPKLAAAGLIGVGAILAIGWMAS